MFLDDKFINKLCAEINAGAPLKVAAQFLGVSHKKITNYLESGQLTIDSLKKPEFYTEYERLTVRLHQRLSKSKWAFVEPVLQKLHESNDTKAQIWIMEKYVPEFFGKSSEDNNEPAKQVAPLIINTQPKELGNEQSHDGEQSDVSTTVDARYTTNL